MNRANVTTANFAEYLKAAIEACQREMSNAQQAPTNEALIRDLRIALQSLDGMRAELEGRLPSRPRGRRSALFTRYLIDEGPQAVMEAHLRDLIVQLEDVYARL
ncbi:MAG: hypothetical protein WB347_12655 [Terriglobales bacterium]